MPKKALVTGGAGFIGSHVARSLIEMDIETVVLDDLSGGFVDNVPEGAHFVEGSILDCELIENLFEQYSFDYVYHLAAYAAEGLSHFIRHFNYTNNLIGSVNLINASVNHDVERFVFTSSIAVYGAIAPPMKEETTPIPEDPYGVAKLAVEHDLRAAHAMFGLDYTIFRPHNVYGEGQNIGDPYRNVVGIFLNQILKDEPLTIFGDGEQMRAFSHIQDVAPIIAESVLVDGARNELFNIGADTPFSVNTLAAEVSTAMGAELTVNYLPERNEVKTAFADHSKCDACFGTKDKTSLQDGITMMASWARIHGSRESTSFDNIEIARNMPPSWAKITQATH